jgi:hypothetical protein
VSHGGVWLTVCRHISPRFSGTWVARGRVRASALQTILRGSGGDLFGYVAGLLRAIGCLEGQCEAGGGGSYEESV